MTMLRRIVLIGGAGIIGAASLALVQIRVGSLYGVSGELDAFFIGAAIPSVLLAIGAAAISSLVVPRLPAGDPAATAVAAGRMAVRAALIAIPLTAFVVLAAPVIVRIIGPGLSAAVADQAGSVLRIYALSIPGTAVAFVFSAYGYASGRIWASGLSTSAYALVWLGLLFLDPFTDDVQSAALAGLIATGVQVVAAYLLSSFGAPRPRPVFSGIGIGHAGLMAIAAVLGATIVARAGLLLDPLFGSLLPQGSVSQLSYATRITALAVLVCGQGAAFSLLIVGRQAPSAAAERESRVGLIAPVLFSTSAMAVLLIAGPQLSELILARGELSVADARAVGLLLQLSAPAVVPFTVVWALEALLYAELRTSAVLYRALAGLVVNALVSALLVLALGIEGRPLGVLVGVVVQLALLMALFWDDPRIAPLRTPRVLRLTGLHALAVALGVTLAYVGCREAGSPDVGVALTVVVAGSISLMFLRSFQADQLLPVVPETAIEEGRPGV